MRASVEEDIGESCEKKKMTMWVEEQFLRKHTLEDRGMCTFTRTYAHVSGCRVYVRQEE